MALRESYVLTISTNKTDHHFEANPKVLHTDDHWMQLLKEVADFMAERGTNVERVKTKMKDWADIYTSEIYDKIQQEQDRAAGGPDEPAGPVTTGGITSSGELVSAGGTTAGSEPDSASSTTPVAWGNFPEADRPGSTDADED